MSQEFQNEATNPRLLTQTPVCQEEGCTGHPVAVYHSLGTVRYEAIVNGIPLILGCKKERGLRIYSGTCWKHQDWAQYERVKFDLLVKGSIPLHSKLVVA